MRTTADTEWPLGYLITFTCYGTWTHGDARGSVDREHNQIGTPFLPASAGRRRHDLAAMSDPPYALDAPRRSCVLGAILEVARLRGWRVFAVHVRTKHVHVVVHAAQAPERVMNDFKAFSSKRLNEAYPEERERKRWTRHGSTRYLNSEQSCAEAIAYVVDRQGEPMAVYVEGLDEPPPGTSRADTPRPDAPRPDAPRPNAPRLDAPRPNEPPPH
jgi:hypothetical protein